MFESERGYRMYGRDDWVSPRRRASSTATAGYLHKPCVRIYDPATLYYVDVDWHQRLSAAQLPSLAPAPPRRPRAAQRARGLSLRHACTCRAPTRPVEGDVWCNEEGFNGNDPGGCRRHRALFPLSSVQLYGVEMKVPADSAEVLRDMYGDSWRQPRPKGYKVLFCGVVGGSGGAWKVYVGVAVWEACMVAVLWQLGKVDQKVVAWVRDRYK